LRALVFAVAILFAPAAPIVAQDSQDFILPELGSESLLMAELAEAKVTFVHPAGVGEINDMQIGMSDRDLLFSAQVTVPPDGRFGGTKIAAVKPSMKTAASLSVKAPPGQAITFYVDEVNAGDGYSLADFRCNYNAGDEAACDGTGFSDISVASGTLVVGATLIAKDNGMSGPGTGSFDITISYQ
jgi:hypothetical protein